MFFPSSNTKPAEKNKKAARILLPAARTASEHLNRRTVRIFLVFTVLSLLLCRLICVLLIPRCEPTLIMHFIKNTQEFCLLRQGNLSIHRIRFIENEAAVRAGKTVQRKDIPVLFEKSPYLCLFPAPALTQFFHS